MPYGSIFATAVVALLVLAPAGSRADIVVDDAPLTAKETFATVPLFAYRKIPDDAIVMLDRSGDHWLMTSSAIVGSATSDPLVKSAFDKKRKSNRKEKHLGGSAKPKPDDLTSALAAYQAALAIEGKQGTSPAATGASEANASTKPILAAMKSTGPHVRYEIDAVATRKILEMSMSPANGWATYQPKTVTDADSDTEGVPVDADFAKSVKSLYQTVSMESGPALTVHHANTIATATKVAAADTRVASATLVRLTDIRFGQPIAFPAHDKKLAVEPSIAKRYDVYWIEFVVSPGEDVADELSELLFTVSMQDATAIALELVPLRYGTEASVKQKAQTPEVSVEAPNGGKVAVGEIYEQTIEYKELKPTVMATGLHDANFGWVIKGDALDPSSKRLIAIVGVRKNTHEIPLALTVAGTLRDWGLFQSRRATTEPQLCVLKLPN